MLRIYCNLCNGGRGQVATSDEQLRCAYNSENVCNMESCLGTPRMADANREDTSWWPGLPPWISAGVLSVLLLALVSNAQDIHPEEIYRRMPAPKPIPWIVDYQHTGRCVKLIISHEPSFGPTSPDGPMVITLGSERDPHANPGFDKFYMDPKYTGLYDVILDYYSSGRHVGAVQIPTPVVEWPKLPDGVARIRATLWGKREPLCSEEFTIGEIK
jgi:hypothetical protein